MIVLDAVRDAQEQGLFYDDDVRSFVAEALGVENDRELSRACYQAKGTITDEKNQARIDALRADGFARLDETDLSEGERFTILQPTTYVGQTVPTYSRPIPTRVAIINGATWLIPKGRRTNGYRACSAMLVRQGWD